ncbi:MAG: M1 family aminopeptidase [Bacteroidota bacterium]
MNKLSLIVVLLVFSITLTAQKHYERLAAIDIQSYKFHISINDDNDEMKGKADISLLSKKNQNEIYLDLVAVNEEGKGMRVNSISSNGSEIEFTQSGEKLTIKPSESFKADTEYHFVIEYGGIPQDGLVIGENKFGDRTFFGDNWPNRARHWLPTVDHPSDKAFVEFIVTAPNHYQVIANGYLVEETDLEEDFKLTHWKTDVVLSTKLMVIGVAPFAVQYLGNVQGVPMSSWIFTKDRENGFYDYSQATGILDWFIGHVGPYPYAKLANVQSKTRYGGMENAGNIFYYEFSVTGNREIEGLLAHEIAHQWFGNSASEANWHHIWLSEGFATYLTNLYMEFRYGSDRNKEMRETQKNAILRFMRQRNVPIVDTSVENYNKLLNANSYQKGGWVLHMLRTKVGDEAFWKGIQTYYKKYQHSNALTEDFRDVMAKITDTNLDQFFQQWIYWPGMPELNVDWSYDAKGQELTFTINQLQEQGTYEFDLEVDFIDAEGEVIASELFSTDDKTKTFTVKNIETKPSSFLLDPNTDLLFIVK